MVKSALVFNPFSTACRAMETEREISSYDELVHDPIKPTFISVGQPFSCAATAMADIGVALSGVKGPFK